MSCRRCCYQWQTGVDVSENNLGKAGDASEVENAVSDSDSVCFDESSSLESCMKQLRASYVQQQVSRCGHDAVIEYICAQGLEIDDCRPACAAIASMNDLDVSINDPYASRCSSTQMSTVQLTSNIDCSTQRM